MRQRGRSQDQAGCFPDAADYSPSPHRKARILTQFFQRAYSGFSTKTLLAGAKRGNHLIEMVVIERRDRHHLHRGLRDQVPRSLAAMQAPRADSAAPPSRPPSRHCWSLQPKGADGRVRGVGARMLLAEPQSPFTRGAQGPGLCRRSIAHGRIAALSRHGKAAVTESNGPDHASSPLHRPQILHGIHDMTCTRECRVARSSISD